MKTPRLNNHIFQKVLAYLCVVMFVSVFGYQSKVSSSDNVEKLFRHGLNFSQTNFSRNNFKKANLRNALLMDSNLSGADFTDANMSEANLNGSKLKNALFVRTNLVGADFFGADLNGANLSKAILTYADLENTKGLTTRQLCLASSLYQTKLSEKHIRNVKKSCPILLNPTLTQ